jgi:hypothetical protein
VHRRPASILSMVRFTPRKDDYQRKLTSGLIEHFAFSSWALLKKRRDYGNSGFEHYDMFECKTVDTLSKILSISDGKMSLPWFLIKTKPYLAAASTSSSPVMRVGLLISITGIWTPNSVDGDMM